MVKKITARKKWVLPENKIKIVVKPWGNGIIGKVKNVGELWLNYKKGEAVGENQKKYVFKKLYIKKRHAHELSVSS